MTLQYSKKIMEHFLNPRNMGEIKNPDGVGRVGNPNCGDIMEVQIKIKEKNKEKYIEDIKFKTFGCAAAIANTSIMTTIVKGKKLRDAKKITQKEILKHVGQIPPVKVHCSSLADKALRVAIGDYEKKQKQKSQNEK